MIKQVRPSAKGKVMLISWGTITGMPQRTLCSPIDTLRLHKIWIKAFSTHTQSSSLEMNNSKVRKMNLWALSSTQQKVILRTNRRKLPPTNVIGAKDHSSNVKRHAKYIYLWAISFSGTYFFEDAQSPSHRHRSWLESTVVGSLCVSLVTKWSPEDTRDESPSAFTASGGVWWAVRQVVLVPGLLVRASFFIRSGLVHCTQRFAADVIDAIAESAGAKDLFIAAVEFLFYLNIETDGIL